MQTTPKNNPYEREVLIIKSHVRKWFKDHNIRVQDKTYRAVNDALIES